MAFSFLSTKMHKPQLPDNVISRVELLDGSSRASVILVSAQAGSGKSTIVSSWLSKQSKPYSWYAIDEWDNDLTQFFTFLIAGIKSIDGQAFERLEQLLETFQSIGFEVFLKALIYQLHAIDHPFILVFDDYHVIRNEQIHQVLRTTIEHLPPSMQLVMITREDPPFPLAKLRASKRLFELRFSQLKFTVDQVKVFFLQQLNLNLEEEQLQLLFKRTEGWIAGLQMTALSMQGHADINAFIEAFTSSHYYIMDYLMEEVLEHHPPEIKAFLLATSILESFSADLCDDVLQLEAGTSSTIIDRLVKTNSFIISMDLSHQWYRYHNLFRELLRQRLDHQTKIELGALHLRSGLWFKANKREQEAIHHLLNANAFEEAAALIECKWAEMDMQLRASSWLDMAKQLPKSILEKSPVLSMGYGWALLDTGFLESCGVWFDKAQALYDLYQSSECPKDMLICDMLQFDLLPATIASARGYIAAATGDMEGVFKNTREALARIPSDQCQKRGVVTMLLAVAHWGIGELNEAEKFIVQSIETVSPAESPLAYNSMYMVLGELYTQQGCLNKASMLFEQTISRVARENQVPILLASLHLGLAKAAFLRGENQQARAYLEDSKTYGQRYSLMDWKHKYYLLLARLYYSEGFVDLARDCLRESKDNYFMNPIPDDVSIEDMEALVNMAETLPSPVHIAKDAAGNSPFLQEHANRSLSESLTVRELEVLALIASGSSNQKICDTLFLALSTVKGYNQTIYGKLQVKRRTEAVIKAKTLGLV